MAFHFRGNVRSGFRLLSKAIAEDWNSSNSLRSPKKDWTDGGLFVVLVHLRQTIQRVLGILLIPRSGPATSFPDFSFIEPKYFGEDQNDDHPPHNVMKTEKLIADIYNSLRANEELWNSSLLVVLFDEHGGFYDHLPPPPAVPPDEHQEEYSFDRLGVRVPAVLVSPWVGKRVEPTHFDHTSLLKYITEKWQLGSLGARTAAANSIAVAITESQPRQDSVPFIRVPYSKLIPDQADLEKQDSGSHHQALHAFATYLREELPDRAAAEALQEAAIASNWITGKAWLGRWLIKLGNGLAKQLDTNNKDRIKLAVDTVMSLLGQPGR